MIVAANKQPPRKAAFSIANLSPLTEEIGVDVNAFTACFDSGKILARINQDIANRIQAGVTGAPATFSLTQKSIQDLSPERYH